MRTYEMYVNKKRYDTRVVRRVGAHYTYIVPLMYFCDDSLGSYNYGYICFMYSGKLNGPAGKSAKSMDNT